jgi:uncharacterized membrane protein HdeD (DUF308 family)
MNGDAMGYFFGILGIIVGIGTAIVGFTEDSVTASAVGGLLLVAGLYLIVTVRQTRRDG